jgi:uroporphyrinogen decarboxylase
MGRGFRFLDAGGVAMEPTTGNMADLQELQEDGVAERLEYVGRALDTLRKELDGKAALLGFAGSPWTLANFMLEGGSALKFVKATELFLHNRPAYDLLAEKLTRAVTDFLRMQIAHGADAVQIFDSLGGELPSADFPAASGHWMARIIAGLQGRAPVIVYSKGTRDWHSLGSLGANVIGIDHGISLVEAERHLPRDVGLQGNLAPALLSEAKPEIVVSSARALMEQMRDRNGYIFNLGHGVPPSAKMENLEALAATVQNFV